MTANAFEDVIFPGSSVTVGSSAVLIMLFVLKHKLTMTAAADLVNLLVAHLPKKHKAFTSLYRFKKYNVKQLNTC